MPIFRGEGGSGDSSTDAYASEIAEYANTASTKADEAAASASAASTSASNAATSESNASTSASNAATSASNASTSASNAATSETNAAASYDSFDDRYLGAKTSDPTLDNDGDALLTGALYFNSTSNEMKVYNGSSWGVVSGGGGSGTVTSVAMTVPTGLSVSGSPVTSSGTLAVTYTAGYAIPTTAKQTQWDTAYGWGDHSVAGYLTSFTETNDLTAAVTWANVPDANITQSSVTQHQAALSITESQISDFGTYLTTVAINDVSDVVITTPADNELLAYNNATSQWINQTPTEAGFATVATSGAYSDLSGAPTNVSSFTNDSGYLTSFTETDPVVGAITGIVKADGLGNISAAVAGTDYLTSYTETDTLDSVTGRGATTTNDISVGDITADQSLTLANGAKVTVSTGNSAFTDFLGGSTDNTSDDGLFAFYGGRAYNQGAGVVLYGDDHATLPNVISFRNTTFVERFAIQADGTASFKNGIEEAQYSLTGTAIDPANGTIQYKTLAANTTFTESLADGEFVTLMIDDGAGYTITWPTTTWVGGSAPTLETTGYNVIELWHVNGTLYGAFVGAA